MRSFVLGVAFVVLSGAAAAEPLKIRNGRPLHMVVAGKRQAAVGVGGARDGWKVTLDASAAGVVELCDVTTGTPVGRQNVRIVGGSVRLAPESFTAGHAYTARLRTVTGATFDALLYLYPPRGGGRVTFGEHEGDDDGAVAISEKGTL